MPAFITFSISYQASSFIDKKIHLWWLTLLANFILRGWNNFYSMFKKNPFKQNCANFDVGNNEKLKPSEKVKIIEIENFMKKN